MDFAQALTGLRQKADEANPVAPDDYMRQRQMCIRDSPQADGDPTWGEAADSTLPMQVRF